MKATEAKHQLMMAGFVVVERPSHPDEITLYWPGRGAVGLLVERHGEVEASLVDALLHNSRQPNTHQP